MLERVATCFQKPCRLNSLNILIIDATIKPDQFNSLLN